jgi:hypothetical protein
VAGRAHLACNQNRTRSKILLLQQLSVLGTYKVHTIRVMAGRVVTTLGHRFSEGTLALGSFQAGES